MILKTLAQIEIHRNLSRKISGNLHDDNLNMLTVRLASLTFATRRAGSRLNISVMTTKEKVLEAVRRLPEDAQIEHAMERLLVIAKIERGHQAG